MKILIVSLISILFFSCKTVRKNNNTVEQISKNIANKEVINKKDTLGLQKVKFNNKSLFFKYSDIISEKDSITDTIWECGNPFGWEEINLKEIHINNTNYITNTKEAVLYEAFFIDNKLTFNQRGKLVELDEHTTLSDFKNIFSNTEIINISREKYIMCYVPYTNSQTEDHWIFFFDKGNKKVVKFLLTWWLC